LISLQLLRSHRFRYFLANPLDRLVADDVNGISNDVTKVPMRGHERENEIIREVKVIVNEKICWMILL
jgi:hypothetical protein